MAEGSAEGSETPTGVHTSSTGFPNDPSVTGYDPHGGRQNWYSYFMGRMTIDGQNEMREELMKKNEERDCKRCEEYRDYNMRYSPTVTFLKKSIEELNGELDANNVKCVRCPMTYRNGRWLLAGGGFSADHGIMLCANQMKGRKDLEDTMAHEMVHAWDHLRWKMDSVNDLRHVACTEIRAANLSGQCRWVNEFFKRSNYRITAQAQECVKMKAIKSVMMRPACKDDVQATKVVNEVWDSCYNDTRPFDEVYR